MADQQIKHWRTRQVLFECTAASVSEALQKGIAAGANLAGAYLAEADLAGANLAEADLAGANLARANLARATINWQSHHLVGEILRRAADEDGEKLKIAGVVTIMHPWCWEKFLGFKDPLEGWALEVLAPLVKDGDNAPKVLRALATKEKP